MDSLLNYLHSRGAVPTVQRANIAEPVRTDASAKNMYVNPHATPEQQFQTLAGVAMQQLGQQYLQEKAKGKPSQFTDAVEKILASLDLSGADPLLQLATTTGASGADYASALGSAIVGKSGNATRATEMELLLDLATRATQRR